MQQHSSWWSTTQQIVLFCIHCNLKSKLKQYHDDKLLLLAVASTKKAAVKYANQNLFWGKIEQYEGFKTIQQLLVLFKKEIVSFQNLKAYKATTRALAIQSKFTGLFWSRLQTAAFEKKSSLYEQPLHFRSGLLNFNLRILYHKNQCEVFLSHLLKLS